MDWSNKQLVNLFNDGWKLADGKFEATSQEGEDWKWQVLRKKVDKGPLTVGLPKGIEKMGTAVVIVFK